MFPVLFHKNNLLIDCKYLTYWAILFTRGLLCGLVSGPIIADAGSIPKEEIDLLWGNSNL